IKYRRRFIDGVITSASEGQGSGDCGRHAGRIDQIHADSTIADTCIDGYGPGGTSIGGGGCAYGFTAYSARRGQRKITGAQIAYRAAEDSGIIYRRAVVRGGGGDS